MNSNKKNLKYIGNLIEMDDYVNHLEKVGGGLEQKPNTIEIYKEKNDKLDKLELYKKVNGEIKLHGIIISADDYSKLNTEETKKIKYVYTGYINKNTGNKYNLSKLVEKMNKDLADK